MSSRWCRCLSELASCETESARSELEGIFVLVLGRGDEGKVLTCPCSHTASFVTDQAQDGGVR